MISQSPIVLTLRVNEPGRVLCLLPAPATLPVLNQIFKKLTRSQFPQEFFPFQFLLSVFLCLLCVYSKLISNLISICFIWVFPLMQTTNSTESGHVILLNKQHTLTLQNCLTFTECLENVLWLTFNQYIVILLRPCNCSDQRFCRGWFKCLNNWNFSQ